MASRAGPSRWQHSEEELAAAEATIQVTLGALLRQMNQRGGESWTLKEGQEDAGKRSVMEGMRHEIRSFARALLGEPSWKNLPPEHREKLMKDRQSAVKFVLHHEMKARVACGALGARVLDTRSSKKQSLKSQQAWHEEAGRPEESEAESMEATSSEGSDPFTHKESETEAGKAVADTNSEGSDLFTQEESVAGTNSEGSDLFTQEESVTEAGEAVAEAGKAVVDTNSFTQEESVTESVAEAGKAVADTNSEGSDLSTQVESENELGKRLEMMDYFLCPLNVEEDHFRKAILRALLNIKEKMENKNKKQDDYTWQLILLLLKGMSNRLDQGGYDEKNDIAKGKSAIETCLDTNDGMDMTMTESDIKSAAYPSVINPMAIQVETSWQMFKDSSDSINEGTCTTMVESDIKPAADPSATNSITIQAETLQQMVKDFSGSMRSKSAIQEHMPMVRSDNLLIEPADPSSTDSMTRLRLYSLQDDLDRVKMAEATSDDDTPDGDTSDDEEKFASYRRSWECMWSRTCGSFNHMTALSSMQFTYYTPRCKPPSTRATTPETLQIFSIKLAEIADGHEFGWPLSVYGMVAVRDVVDHSRNFLFSCCRDSSQELTQKDPFLRLIGPSRAVVFGDGVHFEIKLVVKGTTRSEDKALITEGRNCRHIYGHAASTIRFENCFCKIESRVQLVRRTTQATILCVQVANIEKWPFKYGARVACSSLPGKLTVNKDNQAALVTEPASGELVMVDSKDGAKLKGGDGYLHLSRNVVSVEGQGRLDVDIQAYSESGGIAAQHLFSFEPRFSKITRKKCFFGDAKVVIIVAWSLVATDKRDVMSDTAYV